jgi:hypothetical protein
MASNEELKAEIERLRAEKLLGMADEIRALIRKNDGALKKKE